MSVKLKKIIWITVVLPVLLSGCAAQKREVVTIEKMPYERTAYQTVEVQQGDLNPEVTIILGAEGYEILNYSMTNPELQLDKVYVSVGDKVQEGELLASFKSGSLEENIAGYEEQITQMQLMVEHYTNLMKIDAELDYRQDIEQLRQDINVVQLYLEEAQEKLAGYQIIATRSGTIKAMDEYLQNGYYQPGKNLITEACGTGNYTAETEDADIFSVGTAYTAYSGAVGYEVRLKDSTDGILTFEPISDMSSVSDADTLTITVDAAPLSNVLYVDKDAIHRTDDASFVYVVSEDGYRDAVWVKTGAQVGDYLVIEEGLSGGEKVALN